MKYLSMAYFLGFMLYLWLAVYVLSKNPIAALNRVCAVLIFAFGFWSLNRFLMTNAAAYPDARLFDNIGSAGWCGFPAFALWAALIFTKKKKVLNKWFFYPLLFAAPLALIFLQWSGQIMDAVRAPFGWTNVWTKNAGTYLFCAYYVLYMAITLRLFAGPLARPGDLFEKKHASVNLITAGASLALGSASDVVLNMLGFQVPQLAVLAVLIWACGIVYAISRYNFMTVTAVIAANEIVDTMPRALFVLGTDLSIIETNGAARLLTGRRPEELAGKPLRLFFPGDAFLFYGANGPLLLKGPVKDHETAIQTGEGGAAPVSFSSSIIKDSVGDAIGIVCIVSDMREILDLQQKDRELAIEKERTRVLEESRAELGKLVGERAMELKKSCNELAEKIATLERFQKITAGRELQLEKLKEECRALSNGTAAKDGKAT